jgi:hypothetical protein
MKRWRERVVPGTRLNPFVHTHLHCPLRREREVAKKTSVVR